MIPLHFGRTVFFYGAPALEAMSSHLYERKQRSHSFSDHGDELGKHNLLDAGVARTDPIIYAPNGIWLVLGIAQGVLVCIDPRVQSHEFDESNVGLVDEGSCGEENLVV